MNKNLKLAIVAAGKRHQDVASEANAGLPQDDRLSEHDVTRLVTGRMSPTPIQAAALARVLGRSTIELFPPEVSA